MPIIGGKDSECSIVLGLYGGRERDERRMTCPALWPRNARLHVLLIPHVTLAINASTFRCTLMRQALHASRYDWQPHTMRRRHILLVGPPGSS
jgi:hypothetical protein